MMVQFIFTYDGIDQDVWEHDFDVNITEKELMCRVFDELGKEDAAKLLKISTCQFYEGDERIKFLLENGGKYYFNNDINNDAHTNYWKGFRDGYIQSMK